MTSMLKKSIPTPFLPFFRMANAGDQKKARQFFEQALQDIYQDKELIPAPLMDHFDWAWAAVKMFNPKSESEAFLCAQYVLCHVMSMHKINQKNYLDQRMAIRLIKLSHKALEKLKQR